jgi:hypothetical protein
MIKTPCNWEKGWPWHALKPDMRKSGIWLFISTVSNVRSSKGDSICHFMVQLPMLENLGKEVFLSQWHSSQWWDSSGGCVCQFRSPNVIVNKGKNLGGNAYIFTNQGPRNVYIFTVQVPL